MLNVIIESPNVVRVGESARLSSTVVFEGAVSGSKQLYFEVKSEYEQFLCYERCDAFVIALLLFLMEKSETYGGVTIKSNTPISERLWFSLTTWWIPALVRNCERYGNVSLDIPVEGRCLGGAGEVATGISGGVDSTYTVVRYSKAPGHCRLTYGLYLNWRNSKENDEGRRYDELESQIARQVCESAGLKYLEVRSNVTRDLYGEAHAAIITSVFSSYIMAIQKLIRRYYFSSTCPASLFEFSEHDMEHFDLFTLPCFATENLEFFLSGAEVSRIEKLDYISNVEWTKDTLTVCGHWTDTDHQCSRCSKCTRTMCDLDVLGKLDLYEKRFDIDAFRNNPKYYYGYVIMLRNKNIFCREILDEMHRRGMHIPLSYWVAAFNKWRKRGFHGENPWAREYRTRSLEEVLAKEV